MMMNMIMIMKKNKEGVKTGEGNEVRSTAQERSRGENKPRS